MVEDAERCAWGHIEPCEHGHRDVRETISKIERNQ